MFNDPDSFGDAQPEDAKASNRVRLFWILGAAVAAVIVVVAIGLWNAHLKLQRFKNELHAIDSVRSIHSAEIGFEASHPQGGYACSLADLGAEQRDMEVGAAPGWALAPDLASGKKEGYVFEIVNCSGVRLGSNGALSGFSDRIRIMDFKITAVPQVPGKSGDRGFCADQSGEVRYDPKGGTNCTQNLP